MFKLAIATILFASLNAHALDLPQAGFHDVQTRDEIKKTVTSMRQTGDFASKYSALVDLEAFVNKRVEAASEEIPNMFEVKENDPALANYVSLNEFDVNLENLKQTLDVQTNCRLIEREIRRVTNTGGSNPEEAPEAFITMEIAKAVCN